MSFVSTITAKSLDSLVSELANVKGPVYDAQNGLGNTPNGADIHYFGVEVMMKPAVYLELADKLYGGEARAKTLVEMVLAGTAIAPSYPRIEVPDGWRDGDFTGPTPKVVGHDGRHRMMAVKMAFGPAPVKVHLFLTSPNRPWRGRDIKPSVLAQLRRGIIEQDGSREIEDAFA